MAKPNLSAERLRELLDYNPETGVFTWRVNRGTNKTLGRAAGTLHKDGSLRISIDGRDRYAGMLAWLYTYGVMPAQKQIEYVNGNPGDARLSNIREHVKSGDREITVDRIRQELDYDPETGCFYWKVAITNSVKVGDVAGALDGEGYRRVKIGCRTFSCHRLAWMYTHGDWPKGEIDHINGVRSDNRIANLRTVSKSENLQNQRKAQRGSRSGLLGAYFNHGKWRSAIQINKKTVSLGNFATAEEAHAAYIQAKRKLHVACTI